MNKEVETEAKRLIERYFPYNVSFEKIRFVSGFKEKWIRDAKQNALICCDEVINEIQYKTGSIFEIDQRAEYWQSVKKQIENFKL